MPLLLHFAVWGEQVDGLGAGTDIRWHACVGEEREDRYEARCDVFPSHR